MKHHFIIPSLAILALMSGCGKNSEQQIAEIKSSLSAGDKILYENAGDLVLSLGNDSLIVRRNVVSGKSDTIFRTTPSDRIGVYTSPGYITMVRKDAADSIGVYSYNISSGEIVSNKAGGIGFLPYFDSDCISVVSVQKEVDAVYEASLTIGLDGQANGDISLDKEICKLTTPKRKLDPWDIVFGADSSDGTVYWWQCLDCGESVKSSGKPPYRGCYKQSGIVGDHRWLRGNRAE